MNKIHKILFALLTFSIFSYAQEDTSEKISTIFFNGIASYKNQIDAYKNTEAIITPAIIAPFKDLQAPTDYSFNTALYHICNFFGKPINRIAMYMGQNGDIQVAEAICKETDNAYILYGFSRGGAVAISSAALNDSKLQALVIEGSPYDVSRGAYIAKCHLGIPFNHKQLFSYIFPAYDPCQEINAEAITHIQNKDLPIFIIHCQIDARIGVLDAFRYYSHFKHEGFTNVYFVTLPEGKHSDLITNPNMAPLYLQALHSFYKAHNLPYLKQHALYSIQELQTLFQPSVSDIENEINKDNAYLATTYENAKARNCIGISVTLLAAVALYCYKK